MNLKESIKNRFNKLNEMMESNDYVSPDMLDQAMSVIYSQSRYIELLESQNILIMESCQKVNAEVLKTYELMNRK